MSTRKARRVVLAPDAQRELQDVLDREARRLLVLDRETKQLGHGAWNCAPCDTIMLADDASCTKCGKPFATVRHT